MGNDFCLIFLYPRLSVFIHIVKCYAHFAFAVVTDFGNLPLQDLSASFKTFYKSVFQSSASQGTFLSFTLLFLYLFLVFLLTTTEYSSIT